ncbi:MAG: hypothetical protein ACXWQQ_06920 [Pseudobdellovibrio sp.]
MSKFIGVFFVVLIFAEGTWASLAPRMYSIMAQINTSVYEATSATGAEAYNNKTSLEILYLVRNGPSFGGRYIIESRNENQTNTGQAYGPMAGYYADNGFYGTFTYDILAKLGQWTNGEGFEFSAGYLEHIDGQMHIGAQFSGRKIRYKTDITNNTAQSKDVTDYFPSISFMYLF